ncbi:MAG: HYR domain-containing protein, partial [Flavobacterium sp.]|uniref:HYR domain-containing protein n=1 Tax=Flavobacterium sp. TaxID=239 RepID=UPI0026110E9C
MKKYLLTRIEQNNSIVKNLSRMLFLGLFLTFGFVQQSYAQVDAFITNLGATTICQGQSTTFQVIISASASPYTVVYSDGTSNFTVNNYTSNGDPESPGYGGDAISVSPTSSTNYTLVSVTDQYSTSLPVNPATFTINVNPLPTSLSVTVNPVSPVCPGVNFTISATATNGSTYELWNQANTTKIGDLPYITSIVSNTTYTVRAISSFGCTISQPLTVNVDNVKPVITCPANQTINPNPTSGCSAALPDYRSLVTVSDNCTATGSIVLVQSPVAGTLISGHNTNQTVTITATDASGNFDSCSFTAILIDNINPAISCVSNQNVPASASCTYTKSGTDWNPVGTDNCTVASTVYTLSGATSGTGTNLDGVVFQPGTTTVTWTVTDGAGLTAQCSFNVSITDTVNPIVNCVANQTVNTDNGVCTYTKSGTSWDVTASDNCTVASISYVLSGATTGTVLASLDNAVFNKGVTNVDVTVADGASIPNTASCSFTVTINDVQPPSITCPANISQNIDAGECGAVVTYTAPIGTDNCSGASTAQTAGLVSGSVFPVGETTNTFETTDASGNKTSCSFTVTITDNELPTISCPANIEANVTTGTCGAVVIYTAPVGADNCAGAITTQIAGLASGATFPSGITTNTFRVTDASGNYIDCSFTVTVTDNEKPIISNCPSNITQTNDTNLCSAVVTWTEPTATDNCTSSGSLVWTKSHTPGSVFPIGTTTVTYTATDASNNISDVCSFDVTVTDSQKPVITGCPANITKSSGVGVCTSIVSWTEPSATDNCTASGNLIWTKSHTPGTLFSAGTTTVTYTATDAAGNISNVCSFDVTVVDSQKPIISGCPTNITVVNTTGLCTGIATWTEPTATDNCTASGSIVWTKSHLPGDVFPIGTTTVTYTAKDLANNTSTPCSFNVTVTESEFPVATCKPATIYLNGSGVATLTVADVNDGSTDNCTAQGSLIITLSKTTFNCSNKGDNTVVMSVKDAAGNTSTCNATVTVVDNTAPTITASATTTTSSVNEDSGLCYYVVKGSEFDPIIADNCTGTILSYTVSGATTLSGTGSLTGIQLLAGANLITWTAVDASGNAASAPLTF